MSGASLRARLWAPLLVGAGLCAACAQPAPVRALRVGVDPERVRIVFDLAVPLEYQVEAEGGELRLRLTGAGEEALASITDTGDPIVPRIAVRERRPATLVAIQRRGLPPYRAFALERPPRVVVDVQKRYQAREEKQIAEGAIWSRTLEGNSQGFRATNLVRIDWRAFPLTVRPALATDTVMERDTVRRIAARHGALAAINGGFFAQEGPPLGWLVVGQEWIKLPPWPRTVLAWWPQPPRYLMDQVFTIVTARFERGDQLEVFALNATPQSQDDLALFTPRWGADTPALAEFMGLSVADGRVSAATGWGEAASIPPAGFALLLHRRLLPRLHQDIRLGDRVELSFRTRPDWGAVDHGLGAGPRLVREGKVSLTTEIERFQPDVATSQAARAAVGLTRTGEMIWATVDGHGPQRGMTLPEWARWLLAQGAWDAMNLDGGASTSLVVQGDVKTFPADGIERRVSNALLLFAGGTGPP